MSVDMDIGQYVWVDVGVAEQEKLVLYLWDDLVPQVEGKIHCRAAEDADEMVLPCLDCALCYIVSLVVWGDQLIGHVGVLDFLPVRLRYFVV